MIAFPNAKINLGLRIRKKRLDGYHDIESCFYPVAWNDILEIVEDDEEKLTISGRSIPGLVSENLCWKAYQLVKRKYSIPSVYIHLHKVIPMGGGTGGGSSDAAFAIKALNNLFSLSLSGEELEDLASQVGSDCPFFIQNETAIATGRGTDLKPFSLDLKGMQIVLVNSGINMSTAEAYGGIRLGASKAGEIEEILNSPVRKWKEGLINDFEEFAFQQHPELGDLKTKLYQYGALYASMTGSGSTLYGIFEEIPELKFPAKYLIWSGDL